MKGTKRFCLEQPGFMGEVESLLNHIIGYPAGSEALKGICAKYGGSRVYIPSETDIYVYHRNRQIKGRFTGNNHMELAFEFGLSKSQIRRILRKG